ncbi:virion structural protein [Pseudoalteromonas phage pYD6-A]|uniref:Uncharacterized protein n=1 Tax=Pseudoalteromonas phage pYD6-A TaxID=754052 RepID=M4SS45_9CAUD|nr:virion structural protein [Pseudoalteromonas phage pYD6-A]AGH57626.1 hypothetical protein PYDG_00097 [Pseudoalteromonas phage pYD6-A]
MKLSEFFSLLTYGELANLKVGGKDCGGIYPKYADEVTSYIRQGLTDLHSRFALKHSEVIVQQFEHITLYPLRSDYAVSNTSSTEPYKWISDTIERPFQDDIILIESVIDEGGNEIKLNTENDILSVYSPQPDVLQIVSPKNENAVAVMYKANHTKIDLSTDVPSNIEIEIPPQLVRPLALYVSSLAHTSVGSIEGFQTGASKMIEYETACIQIDLLGLIHKEDWVNENIWRNGWV